MIEDPTEAATRLMRGLTPTQRQEIFASAEKSADVRISEMKKNGIYMGFSEQSVVIDEEIVKLLS